MKLVIFRKQISIILIIILVLVAGLFLWATPSPSAWLTGWNYREPLIVVERSGKRLVDYQVRVVLDEKYFDFSRCRPHGEDIRFTDEEENHLSFWIEKWPSESDTHREAIIWVKIPELKPYEKKLIYMYYGNPIAESYSNLTSTMDILEVVKETVPSRAESQNAWSEIRFSNPEKIEVVISSPPSFSDNTPATVRIKRESDKWYASVVESSVDDNLHQPEQVYFLGMPLGTYKFVDGTIVEARKVDLKATSAPYTTASEKISGIAFFKNRSSTRFVSVSSLQTLNSQSSQERMMQIVINRNTDFSSFLSAQGEYDNTLPLSTTETAAVVRFSSASPVSKIYNSVVASYDYLEFFSIETTNSTVTIGFFTSSRSESPIFITPYENASGYFPFARILTSEKDFAALYLQKDPTAPEDFPSEGDISYSFSILRLSATGVFPIAKAVFPEPHVYFDRINGKVFEDSDGDGFPFESGDQVKKGVKVRLYEDVNVNGRIDSQDVFCYETETDNKGVYHLPARENRTYIVAVSAASLSQSEKGKLNPGFSIDDILPEQTFVAEYKNGNIVKREAFGGNDPFVTDNWSSDANPEKNIYEHTAQVERKDEEVISGVDFGFSYDVVTNSSDFREGSSRIQGSLRQAIINANARHGRQQIVFALNTSDPSYNRLTDEFVFSPLEELPPIIDPLIIDGAKQRFSSGSTILISGTNIPFKNGLTVEAPHTEVRNIGFSGFQEGLHISTYQYERSYSKESLESLKMFPFIPFSTPETNVTGAFVNPNFPDLIDFVKTKDFATGSSICWISSSKALPEVSYVYGGLKSFISPRLQTFPEEHFIVIPARRISLTVFAGTLEGSIGIESNGKNYEVADGEVIELGTTSSAIRMKSFSHFFAMPLDASFSSVGGNSYKGRRFAAFLEKNDALVVVSSTEGEETTLNITHKFSDNFYQYETTITPYVYRAKEEEVIIFDSKTPVYAAKETSTGANIILYPASTKLTSVVRDGFELIATENTDVRITVTTEDGSKISGSFQVKAGEKLDSKDISAFKEVLGRNQYLAVMIESQAPVVAVAKNATGLERPVQNGYSFTAPDSLGTGAILPADSDELVILSSANSAIEIIKPDGNTYNVNTPGTTDFPEIVVFRDRLPYGTIVRSDSPILTIFKNNWTGTICEAQSNALNFDRNLSPVSPSSDIRTFDGDVIIDSCVFLANSSGVVVTSGNGVEITKSRFFSNSVSIDLGGDGRTSNDGEYSIHQPNKGIDSPVIESAVLFENVLTIQGYVGIKEKPEVFEGCQVEVYLADISGQANIYLGSAVVEKGRFELKRSVEGLSISSKDRVVAVAIDSDGSTSEFSEPLRVDPPPVISNVRARHILPASDTTPQPTVTTITWVTDIPSTSKVVYDIVSRSATETYSYETTESTELVTTHTVVITGLDINTVYYFRVISKNIDGDVATSYEYVIPPGRLEADTDLCAYCHRAHTGVMRNLRLPYVRE